MPKSAIAAGSSKSAGRAGAGVYSRIKEDILSNTFPAGLHIQESKLADELGISRTPVREAMIRLEAEGLVEVLPRRGVRVLPVRASDMREIYDILMALESLAAAQLASGQCGAVDLSGLEAAIETMEASCEGKEFADWAKGDDRFHREILRLTGNARLIAITDALYSQAHRTQMITLRMRDSLQESNQEHREIVDGIRRSDAEGAASAMRGHRRRGGREIVGILETYGLPPL